MSNRDPYSDQNQRPEFLLASGPYERKVAAIVPPHFLLASMCKDLRSNRSRYEFGGPQPSSASRTTTTTTNPRRCA